MRKTPDPDDLEAIYRRKVTKRRRKVRHTVTTNFEFNGALSQTGRLYVAIERRQTKRSKPPGSPRLFIPLRIYSTPSEVAKRMNDANFLVPYSTSAAAAMREASQVRDFDLTPLAEVAGWNDAYFILRDGTCLAHCEPGNSAAAEADEAASSEELADRAKPELTFDAHYRSNDTAGSVIEWMDGLSALLQDQDILTLSVLTSFAAPILQWSPGLANFGIELVGPAGSGKTIAAALAASVWGAPRLDLGLLNAAYINENFVERRLQGHADQPVIIDGIDQWFATETDREQACRLRCFASLLEGVIDDDPRQPPHHVNLTVISTSREPLAELWSNPAAARSRLADRLMTIPVPRGRATGVVKSLVDGTESSGEAIAQLDQLIRRKYGHAGRCFVRFLLGELARDEAALTAKISKRIKKFVAMAGVDMNNGVEGLAAYRFGLIYAAGRLAINAGAFPAGIDIATALLDCFRLHLGKLQSYSFEARLRSLLDHPDVVNLGSGSLPKVGKKQRQAALAYKRERKAVWEVSFRPEHITRSIDDWPAIERRPDVVALRLVEEEKEGARPGRKHLCVKRKLGAGRDQERVISFRVPK